MLYHSDARTHCSRVGSACSVKSWMVGHLAARANWAVFGGSPGMRKESAGPLLHKICAGTRHFENYTSAALCACTFPRVDTLVKQQAPASLKQQEVLHKLDNGLHRAG